MGKGGFSLDGIILDANAPSWRQWAISWKSWKASTTGLLVDPDYAQSTDYRTFWKPCAAVNSGGGSAKSANRVKRSGSGGSCNPCWKPSKIVKFARDITAK